MNRIISKLSKPTLSVMLAMLMVFTAIPIYAFAATISYTATFEVGESKTQFTYEKGDVAPSDYTVTTLAAKAGFEIPVLDANEYQGWSVNGANVNLSEYELVVGETTFTAIPTPVLVIEEETTPTPPPGPQTTENEGTLKTSEAPAVIATFLKDDGTVLDTVALDAEGKPVDALPTTITGYVASPYLSIQNGVEITIPATLKAWEVKGTEISLPIPLGADSFSLITASVSLSPVVDYIIEDITEDGTPQYDIESIYTVNYYVQSAAATIPNSNPASGVASYTVSFQYPTGLNEYALANSIEYIDVVGKTIEASTFSASIPSWLGEAAGFTVNSALSTTGNVVIDSAGTQAINIYINRNASTITLQNYSKDGSFTPRTVTYNNVRYGTDLSVVNRDPHAWDVGQPVYQRYMWSTTGSTTAQEAALLPNTMPAGNIALYEIIQQEGTVKNLTINAYEQGVAGLYPSLPTRNLVNGQVFTIYNNNYTTVRDTYESAIKSIEAEGYEIDYSLLHTPSTNSVVTAFTSLAQDGTYIANVYYKAPAQCDVFFINATGFSESEFNKKYNIDSSTAINIPASEQINPKPGKVFAGWKIQGSADSTAVEAPEQITIPSGLGPLYITAVWKDAEIIPMDPANAWFNVSSNSYVYNGLNHVLPGAKVTDKKPSEATIVFSYSVDGETYTSSLPEFTDVKRDANGNVVPYLVRVKAHIEGLVTIGEVERTYADTVVTLNVYVYPANVTITANSDAKFYDGTELTNAGFSNSVLPIGVTKVQAQVAGSQTDIGSSNNEVTSYIILKGQKDVTANFTTATLVSGTLTITPRPVVLTIGNATKVAGTVDDFSGVTRTFDDSFAQTRIYVGLAHRAPGFDAQTEGTYEGVLTADYFSANSNNFEITVVNGTLTITAPAPIVVPLVVPPAVVPPVVPAPPAADAPAIITNPAIPLTPSTITDSETPLVAPITASWALVNLILAVAAVLYAIYLAVGYRKGRKGEKSEANQHDAEAKDARGKRGILWRSIAVIFGIVAPVVFLITEDITLPIALVDSWTLLMAAFVLAQIGSAVILHQRRKEQDQNQNQAQNAAY